MNSIQLYCECHSQSIHSIHVITYLAVSTTCMAEQAALRKTLSELSKREDLKNKVCCDCSNPNPQWASLSFAIFICLQCAGAHRGFGVHIRHISSFFLYINLHIHIHISSFVRSISMDTWQDDQVKRMQVRFYFDYQFCFLYICI